MTYKKTWLSSLLWAVFTCVTGMLLADYAISLWIQETNAAAGAGTVVFIAGVFALAVCCCFLLVTIYNKVIYRQKIGARTVMVLENLLVVFLFLAALLYRIYLFMQSSADTIAQTRYFELATVTSDQAPVNLIQNIDTLYTVCLSFALSFFGNKLIAGAWLQAFLQMLSILLGFYTIRKFVGKLPAYTVLILLAFSPVFTGQLFSMTPEVLSFFLYLLAFSIISGYVKNYCAGLYDALSLIIVTVVCGLVIGVLTYLDMRFLTLFILFAWGICGMKAEKASASKGVTVFLFVLAFAAAGLALMGVFTFESYSLGSTIEASVNDWMVGRLHLPTYQWYIDTTSILECFLLVFPASFLIMSFWFRPKVQNAAPWIMLMLLFGPPHMTIETEGYRIYTVFIWCILAGIGVQQCFTPRRKAEYAAEQTESADNTEQIAPTEEKETIKEAEKEEVKMEEKEIIKEIEEYEKKEETEETTPAKPRFIENPLPLPKKHEKRSLDYQYEVDEEKLDFDIEIAENDDYDV